MSFKIVQRTPINTTGDFKFDQPENVDYPIAPLVSAKFYTPKEGSLTLKIRATLYINSDDKNLPTIADVLEIKDDTLIIIYKHDFATTTPATCDVYYVEIDYTSDNIENITSVISFLKRKRKGSGTVNDDDDSPETSRGTETAVRPKK